ncbi:unnamed protein product, partial [Rotaria magnacalcarata]
TTLILADVATNIITDLLLGNDWIAENNVIIDSPQRHIFLTDKYYQIIATTPFIKPPDIHLSILLIDEITLPPYSEKLNNVKTASPIKGTIDVLFEPAHNLYSKQILLANAILKMENNTSQIMIINVNDRQRTLSKNTKLGHISYQTELNNYCILPVLSEDENYQPTYSKSFNYKRNNTRKSGSCNPLFRGKRKVRFTDFTCRKEHDEAQQHRCYVCQEQFLSRNDLQQHLCQKCYPLEMREQIEKLTQHIEDIKPQQQLYNAKPLDYDDTLIGVHAQNEPSNEIGIISDDDIEQNRPVNQHSHQHQPLTRNQRKNRKKREKRYQFEIIRSVYYKFTTRNIKKILIFMNIPYVNFNVVGKMLFLGVKNEHIRKQADEILHSGIFTEEHYYRIRKHLHLDQE